MSSRASSHLSPHVLLAVSLVLISGPSVRGSIGLENIIDGSLFRNLLGLIPGMTKFLQEIGEYQSEAAPDVTPFDGQEYDFIVVGAGTAGAAIASRLSELKNETVLLIEAGPEENLILDIPALALYLQLLPPINWGYRTQPSKKYCLSMNDNRCKWVRGKVMGGSSVLNLMIATRCSPEDYDDWEKMGCSGWSWKDVLPYFKKLERMDIASLKENKEIHNTNGPVSIQYAPYHSKSVEVFLEAGRQLGFPIVDYNDYRSGMGFSRLQTTTINGSRANSNRAYIHPARCRKNLHVSKLSMVERILMDKKGKRAVGVEFKKFMSKIRVYARKEVILAAGAIGSPQLLMLSGIGPAKHLKDKGIEVVKDAPGCGQNLMDHIAYGGILMRVNDSITIRFLDVINPANSDITDYQLYGKGPISVPDACEAVAFIDTKNLSKRHGRPNMELLYISGAISTDSLYQQVFDIRPDVYQHMMLGLTMMDYTWTVFPMLLKPKSRGYIELASNNVYDHPLIEPNYMDHPDDVKIMIEGIRMVQKISETPAWQKYDARLHDNIVPGCESYKYDSDDYWECAIRHILFTIYHYSGTCKMGSRDDPTAVVDPSLKVIGVEGLRVCDASIIPDLMAGHPNIPVYMIAEKFSDQLKQEYGYPIDTTFHPIDACTKDD